jgi:hypothetical protein
MAVIAAAAITAGAAIFGASQSSKASKAAAQAQLQAAQLNTLVARELHDHWKNYYAGCDIAYIQEVCATPVYVPQYEDVAGRTRMEILRSFARARDQARRCADVYCVGSDAQQCNFLSGIEAIALADSVNFGYRYEETQKIQRDQIRLENVYRWLGLGRNLLSQSNAASQVASAAALRLGAQAGQASNGWLQAAGWALSDRGQKAIGDVINRVGGLFGSTPQIAESPSAGGQLYGQSENSSFSSPAPDAGSGSAAVPTTTDPDTGVSYPVGQGWEVGGGAGTMDPNSGVF